jgi:sugar O-acyltransferase (sialic acid O-acetyltransferase NeuD family)
MQSKKRVIIFGVLDTAELAHYYLTHDSPHEVVAFTVHGKYIQEKTFHGLPVVPFESLQEHYPPGEYSLFAPMTAKGMNRMRESVYLEGKQKGYGFISYVSSKATVFNNEIGENCFILEDNTLQPFTNLGNNIVLWSGNHIGHHGIIRDHVFFTSHIVLSGHCDVGSYSFFGVNATIRDYTKIAQGTLLAMGSSLVQQSTEEWGVYIGNPAKRREGKLSTDLM